MYPPSDNLGYPTNFYHYNGNEEDLSQHGYSHNSQSGTQDGQDFQGGIPLQNPYPSSSYVYQQQYSQDWYTQHYSATGGVDQGMYNRSQVHEFREVNTTSPRDIEPYIRERIDQGQKKFFCGWAGCTHTGKFVRKAQLQTHIKSVHLSEKPYICTACNASFTRRQDAARHVETMNSGRQFKCYFCDDGFARKDYRDRHCERCKNR